MSTHRPRLKRYRFKNWSIDIVDKPWFIDALTYITIGLWLMLTYEMIQKQGAGPWVLGAAVAVLAVGLTLIYGQRLTYLRIGDKIVIGVETPETTAEREDWTDGER